MINSIDIVLTLVAVYLFLLGFSRGLMRSLFGPIALIGGSWIAWAYYQNTHQIFPSICLGIFAPMILSILLRIVFANWYKSLDPDRKIGPFSQLAGAVITLIWGWVFVIFTVLLIIIFPAPIKQLTETQHLITQSQIATMTVLPFKNMIIPPVKEPKDLDASLQELSQDPRIAKLMNDPTIAAAAQKGDYAALLKNPKIMELTQQLVSDPKLMKNMMAVLSQQQKQKKPETK